MYLLAEFVRCAIATDDRRIVTFVVNASDSAVIEVAGDAVAIRSAFNRISKSRCLLHFRVATSRRLWLEWYLVCENGFVSWFVFLGLCVCVCMYVFE